MSGQVGLEGILPLLRFALPQVFGYGFRRREIGASVTGESRVVVASNTGVCNRIRQSSLTMNDVSKEKLRTVDEQVNAIRLLLLDLTGESLDFIFDGDVARETYGRQLCPKCD